LPQRFSVDVAGRRRIRCAGRDGARPPLWARPVALTRGGGGPARASVGARPPRLLHCTATQGEGRDGGRSSSAPAKRTEKLFGRESGCRVLHRDPMVRVRDAWQCTGLPTLRAGLEPRWKAMGTACWPLCRQLIAPTTKKPAAAGTNLSDGAQEAGSCSEKRNRQKKSEKTLVRRVRTRS